MSTYWYLECTTHQPPVRSDEEVSQHTDFRLDFARRVWSQRWSLLMFDDLLTKHDLGDYEPGFGMGDRNAATAWDFIRHHPDCAVQFRNEYGNVEPISGDGNGDDQ